MSYLHGAPLVTAAKAAVGRRAYSSMCQAFCVITAGIGAKGDFDGDRDADAVDGWKKAKARGQVVETKDIKSLTDIPAGTLAYWTGGSRGYGHVAVTVGGGKVVSTDAPTWGTIGIVSIDWIAAHWGNGLKFVGYILNDGDGHQMVDVSKASTTKAGKATSPSITHRVTATQLNGRGGPGTDYKIKGNPAAKGKTVVEIRRSGNWVMTATKRWFSLAYLEQVEAAPKPTTEPATVKISSETINLAGAAVNTHGVKTAAKRLSRYTAHLAAHKVTSVLTQEVNSAILGHLNAMLPMQDAKGGNGRFVTVSNSAKVIASGVFTAPDRYNGDDKQCAWIVYEAGGALSCEGSMHLEYRDGAKADAVRVKQANYFAEQLLAKAKTHKVPLGNVMLAGDTNSEGLVLKELLGQKWRNAAAGTDFEDDRTFTGWDDVARKRFDYVLVYDGPGAIPVEAEVTEVVPDTAISDHARLRVVRHLIKNPTK